ncbi:MAG: metallophosphoesterase [Fimbriimonas sp.]
MSDMQFGKYHRFAKQHGPVPNHLDDLYHRLTSDLELLRTQKSLRPDLIICTGDLAEWGRPVEFTDAFDFLTKLCKQYDLPHHRCVVVPGNHDINRAHCEAYFSECKGNDEPVVFPWFPKWKNFKAAFDAFYSSCPGVTFDTDNPWSLFIDDELQVVVAGLNSTMDEGHDAAVNADEMLDKGHHGRCTESQLQWFHKRLADSHFEGWLRIGVVHHNVIRGCRNDNENLIDSDLLGGMLSDHLHLLLHGHTHEAKADMLAAKVRVYSTGTAALKTSIENGPVPTDIPNQYQFLVIQPRAITRYCRQYAAKNLPPGFIADVRQSRSRHDWVITDDVDFRGVSRFRGDETLNELPPTPKPEPPPRTLPFCAVPDYVGSHRFVGREAELTQLNDWAAPADPTNLLLFEAIGGNGKSMLTWEWANNHAPKIRSDWAGRFWYSFYEKGTDMTDFCRRALAYMTGNSFDDFAMKKTAELMPVLLTLLHARPWLLILDGLERVLVAYHRIDAAEVADEEANTPSDKIANRDPRDAIREEDSNLLLALAAAKPSKILVSSRLTPRKLLNSAGQPVLGVRRIELAGLRPTDAEALLRSCDVSGNSVAIQRYLSENCDNHPLVIGILGGLIRNYLPDRGDFDAWVSDPDEGAKLDLASLNLTERRNHILRAALEDLPLASRQLLSTLALLSISVGYEELKAFNPHLPPELEEVWRPTPLEDDWYWEELSAEEKAERRRIYDADLERWSMYEKQRQERLASPELRAAPKKLAETVGDLERRGLLQWDGHDRKYDLHPVVRHVTAGGLKIEDTDRLGRKVVDYFSSRPHNPYGDAESLDDLRPGLLVVRTLLRMNRFQEAADAFVGILCNPLLFNLCAYEELLTIVRPFFPQGWGTLPDCISEHQAIHLADDAGKALHSTGHSDEALEAFGIVITQHIKSRNWSAIPDVLVGGAGSVYLDKDRLAKVEQIVLLGLKIAENLKYSSTIRSAQTNHLTLLSLLGRYEEAEQIWELLRNSDDWAYQSRHHIGHGETVYAEMQLERGLLTEGDLVHAETLSARSKNRAQNLRLLRIRGDWRAQQDNWNSAAENYAEGVRLAREMGRPDPRFEVRLALARAHQGQLDEARSEANRLSSLPDPPAGYLGLLFHALGDDEKAKTHALVAYKSAWADGEPYVHRFALTRAEQLLNELNVPIPVLPSTNLDIGDPLPWEIELHNAINLMEDDIERTWESDDDFDEDIDFDIEEVD